MAEYMFDDADAAPELARLRRIEEIFDPGTQAQLSATGDWQGRRCLEVGAGAGSIARWMVARAGGAGRVTAVDINTRFLGPLRDVAEVVEGDMTRANLPLGHFDVAHARYVLVHNAEPRAVIAAMLRSLKPGGWLLLEEPDFSVAQLFAGRPGQREAFGRVLQAIDATFARRGAEQSLGRRLASLAVEVAGELLLSLELVRLENDVPVVPGGSPIATMMGLSAAQLRQKYLETGLVSERDLAEYQALSGDPACWAVYYSTIRVLARRAE